MQPSDFYFLIIPLAAILFLFIPIVVYYAQREEHTNKELKDLKKKKAKQKEVVNEELVKLKHMLEEKSIDKFTYNRFRKLLMRTQMIEEGSEYMNSAADRKQLPKT